MSFELLAASAVPALFLTSATVVTFLLGSHPPGASPSAFWAACFA